MLRVETIWAYIAHHDDGEGLLAGAIGPDSTIMPLVATDERRALIIRPHAEALAQHLAIPITYARFDGRADLETIR